MLRCMPFFQRPYSTYDPQVNDYGPRASFGHSQRPFRPLFDPFHRSYPVPDPPPLYSEILSTALIHNMGHLLAQRWKILDK